MESTQKDKKKKIALIDPWVMDKTAEREVMLRIKRALNGLGFECIFIDRFGWILDNSHLRTNVIVNPKDLLFAIEINYHIHKTVDTFYYHVVWSPPEMPLNQSQYTGWVTNNYIMNDDFLLYDEGGMKNHLKTILQNCPRDIDGASELVPSFPQDVMLEPKLENPLMFYCGMNWEVVEKGCLTSVNGRHPGLFKLLDNSGKILLFGPDIVKKWDNKRPWAGYKCYNGPIPFDGFTILNEINKCGICLVLSSDFHRRAGAVTNRAYEACAAGAVIISDDNEYMLKNFKDAALFISFNKKDPNDTFNQIMEKYRWIVSHKEEALAFARKAQDIFRQKFALDIQLKKVIANHPARVLQIQKDLYAKDESKVVLVTYILDTLDIEEAQHKIEKIVNNVKKQHYKNITIGIACDNSLSGEMKEFCNNLYENIVILSLGLYDNKGSRCITKGKATRELHRIIKHDYFIMINNWESWFSDHITTLIRAIENTDACAAYSGSLSIGADGYSRTCNFGIYTQIDLFYMTKKLMQQKGGEFLFKASTDTFVPEFVFDNIDGLEHLLYANYITAKKHEKIAFSRRMTYSINETEIDESDKVLPDIMQVRLIQDAVRFDIADFLAVSNENNSKTVSKKEIIDYMMDIPIKQFIKTRIKRRFPKLFKIYKYIKNLGRGKKK